MTAYFLGVDIGNTKSHALITDDTGEIVGFAAGNPGNHEVLGVEGFQQALQQVVQAALDDARLAKHHIVGAGYGIAGYDWPSDLGLMTSAISRLGLGGAYRVVNDSVIGLVAGAEKGWGVVVSAGTSSNCRGRDAHGREGRVTGNGATFGEYGGGVELVYRALQAIARAWSRMAPPTMLTELFIEHVGARDVEDFLEGIARGYYRVGAGEAPLVFQAVLAGDPIACDALTWISRELGLLAIGVIRQLELEAQPFDVVLAGSFYKGSPLIAQTMSETIHAVAPQARLVRLEAPPVVGGVLLGMEAAAFDFIAVRERLIGMALERVG